MSHETIYRALYGQTRGGVRQDLARKLALKRRCPQTPRQRRWRPQECHREAFPISQHPAEVADRAVRGQRLFQDVPTTPLFVLSGH